MGRRILTLGKIAYYGKRKENAVKLIAETERGYFSVCGEVRNRTNTDSLIGGQCVDEIAGMFKHNEAVQNLAKLWRVFHLCDLDKIPLRFRGVIDDFIKEETNNPDFDRLQAFRAKLEITEKVTRYGTYTEGALTVYSICGAERFPLRQGDEDKNRILDRAERIIATLYNGAPLIKVTKESNREQYEQAEREEARAELAEAVEIAKKVAYILEGGELEKKRVKSALYNLRSALRVLKG